MLIGCVDRVYLLGIFIGVSRRVWEVRVQNRIGGDGVY